MGTNEVMIIQQYGNRKSFFILIWYRQKEWKDNDVKVKLRINSFTFKYRIRNDPKTNLFQFLSYQRSAPFVKVTNIKNYTDSFTKLENGKILRIFVKTELKKRKILKLANLWFWFPSNLKFAGYMDNAFEDYSISSVTIEIFGVAGNCTGV